jgi:predicted nucleic acid-binding protein
VLNEFSNVSVRKLKFSTDQTKEFIDAISTKVIVETYTKTTILSALDLKNKYKLQFYDSLIIATALENKCTILYSEDMQDGLIVENILTIVNPFKEKS